MNKKIKSYLVITLGTILMGIGVYFFEFPNNFTTGGISGLSIVISKSIGFLTPGQLVVILNMILLILGLIIFGKRFAFKTIYSSILLSFMIWILEVTLPITNPFTDQKMLELFFDMILVSVGGALIFNEEGSSGGTDIVAMILKKFTRINIGKALLVVDFMIICAALAVFGVETGMYSLFAIIIRALVVDNSIESWNVSKYFLIITDHYDEISSYITEQLERGATIIPYCKGAYTNEIKTTIITVVDTKQAVKLKHYIRNVDKNAFAIIGRSSDIIGDGFKTYV